jgi:hypothetical protein
LTPHNHPTNSSSVEHTHSRGGTHSHSTSLGLTDQLSAGGSPVMYKGNNCYGAPQGPDSNTVKTGISINSASTGISIAPATTGLSVNTVTTALTVDNSPPSPPYPDETRPYNIALLPMIKFRSP